GVANCGAQHREDFATFLIRIRLVGILRNRVVQGHQRSGIGVVRKKNRSEILVNDSGPLEGSGECVSVTDGFLAADQRKSGALLCSVSLNLVALEILDTGGGIGRTIRLV